jgi:hypothetical protein
MLTFFNPCLWRIGLRIRIGLFPTPKWRFQFIEALLHKPIIKLCGFAWIAPDYSTLFRWQKHIDIKISCKKAVMDCLCSSARLA